MHHGLTSGADVLYRLRQLLDLARAILDFWYTALYTVWPLWAEIIFLKACNVSVYTSNNYVNVEMLEN
jgi:hypothetical protein